MEEERCGIESTVSDSLPADRLHGISGLVAPRLWEVPSRGEVLLQVGRVGEQVAVGGEQGRVSVAPPGKEESLDQPRCVAISCFISSFSHMLTS